ncbi:uncharacterized protein LOC127439394, partial [Myxocyprinus asiaticus]|uniref:uncharacterized protein LOC127439394 n=1 Tax=Myxocyprinus asiaticus TaxID=70543 RepID=UPI002222DF47
MCQLSSSSSHSKEIWKLLLTKTNDVLDQALIIFSNTSQPIRGVSVSNVLDVIGELRLEQFSPDQWSDIGFISMLLGQTLRPFLPSTSATLLMCLSRKNLSCPIYQNILEEFSSQFSLMDETERRNMVEFFILPFLRGNTTDPGCVFSANTNTEWLLMNFGPFAQFVSLRDVFSINTHFDPLETLVYLSPGQMVGLMVDELPGLPEKDAVINRVFNHLLESPVERRLPEVLENLLSRSQMVFIPCSSYILIFTRLFQALPFLPSEMVTLVLNTTEELKQNGERGCSLPEPPICLVTPVNATRVCAAVNSNELETLLSAGLLEVPCNISLEQYACSSLTGFTAKNLAELLMCQLSSSSSHSKEIWKLLLTKTNDVLDQALIIFSNTSQPIRGVSVSNVLDVIGELRLEQFSPDQWSDIGFISMLLGQTLRPFLPSTSATLLMCLSRKNLSCPIYQNILEEFSSQFSLMDETERRNMVEFFILPFLRGNTTDPGCVFSANTNTEWLLMNFGPFAQFVSLRDVFSINTHFDPLETLVYLSPGQMVGLMVDELPGLPEKDAVINRVFNHLLESPVERRLPEVLENLLSRSQMVFIPCSSYILIFTRLFQALPFLPSEMVTLVLNTTEELKQNGERGCSLPEPPICLVTPVNATRVCAAVNSNELETLLSAGLLEVPCNISLEQYACSSLTGFTAKNLAELLMCQLSSSSSHSKEIWKLLLTKTNDVLDQALIIFSNTSQPIRGVSVSNVLDVIGELRLEQFSPDQWSDIGFISMLLGQTLRPFLPSTSATLLMCLSRKNLSCPIYQNILEEFSSQFSLMDETERRNMVEFFILPFLRGNTTDPGCVFSANTNTEWLLMNFGPFAQFVSLRDVFSINTHFDPLETLVYLSPGQMVGLMVDELPGLPEKDAVINRVFNHLLESPVERRLPEVLENLLSRSQMVFIPCSSYILIFTRLFQALPFLPSEMVTLVLNTTEELKQNGERGCSLPEPPICLVTPVNATRVCAAVNSNELETLLSAGLLEVPCNISLEQYACSSLTGFTAKNLAELLMCQLSSSSSHSKEIWKLLLTKTNDVLDQALIIFSNTSQPIRGVSVSNVLDVIGELRLEQFSPDQWSDIGFISMLLGQTLRPFLPSTSATLLMCLSRKNLSCPIYQNILEEFSSQFSLMDETERRNMVEFFILPFLRGNTTDPGCVFSANTNTEWLLMNFGPFAQFVSLRDVFSINTHFDPLETLVYLSPGQMVGLMVDELPGLPEKDAVINRVFNHLLESPVERRLPEVLENLLSRSQMVFIPCSSYILIFTRLFQALPFLPSEMVTLVLNTTEELKQNGERGCSLPEPPIVRLIIHSLIFHFIILIHYKSLCSSQQ